MTTPNSATAISMAPREALLLTPEATPARFAGTAAMTTMVSGATAIPRPRPTTARPEKKPDQ